MNSKKINIVTINLNNKEGLEKTIKSVINQTYFDKVNYLVIDGGSTDGSKDVLEEYKQYFDYYISKKDNGRYNAMNNGINKAVGDYILFLNSGDYLHDNNVLEKVYDSLDADIVYGGMNVHTIQGRQYIINDDYYLNKGLPHPSSFIKLDLLKENKYKEEYNIISDWIFFYEQIYLNRASYKQLDTLVSDFHVGGISSDSKAIEMEKKAYFESLDVPRIAMCSIGRLENKYVREFVEFYQKIGVDKFFIYDNNYDGEEHFEDVLKPYVNNKLVEIVNFRNKQKCQLAAYQDCYNRHNEEYDWICFFDFDEYLYLDGYKTLKQLLSQEIYKGYELFHVNEMMYGDSGLLRYEDKPVVERFKTPVMPLDYKKTFNFPENCHVKSIVRGKIGEKVRWNSTPHTPTGNLKCCNALGEQCNGNSPFVIPYIHKNIWLRHYKTKTIEEFYNSKVRRGYPDGNKDFFKTHSWVDDFFKENEKTDEKLAIIKELESKVEDKKGDGVYEGLISIVMPCYNQARYVRDTIISVKASRYSKFCCVIVNDGSTDNSEEVILDEIKGDDRFMYFKTENKGVSHARNFGISKTKSKYIMCLDSDDLISPYYIKEGVEFLEKYSDFNLFYGKAKFLFDENNEREWNARPYTYKSLLLSNMIYCAHIFRRSDYEKTTGYDETMRGYEDWEFLIRMLDNKSNVYRSENVLFYYRRHDDSLDHEVRGKRNRFLLDIFNKNTEKYKENNLKIMEKPKPKETARVNKDIGDKCCVVIPTHKEKFEGDEERSLQRALKIFNGRDIKLVIPNNISTEYYDQYKVEYVKVDPSWMKDIKAYNRMCCNNKFYELFKDYDYMLIYQTDCWVYEDRLDEFMKLKYDWYGAVWPQYRNIVGNGGLSLRAVNKMLEITDKYNYDGRFNEDGWFCITHMKDLDICPFETACNFSWELVTKNILNTTKEAPMGLHGKALIPLWMETTEKLISFKNKITSQK